MDNSADGAFVLLVNQTCLDGKVASIGVSPRIGQVWTWQGHALRLDGPEASLLLAEDTRRSDLNMRAAKALRRRGVIGASMSHDRYDDQPLRSGFIISDGTQEFRLVPIELDQGKTGLIWCPDGVPAEFRVYHVIRVPEKPKLIRQQSDDMICFTAGSRIRTQDGERLVESLRPGDYVQTQDNGPQEIAWIGHRRITGARLIALPELRPIRMRANAIGQDTPTGDLLVSPDHRLLYRGAAARALYNEDEVLVTARDLINDRSIFVDHTVREVTYIHLMFADHQILWANGVPTESFHPGNTSLEMIVPDQRAALINSFPDLAEDPQSYVHARRNLNSTEAAILLHGIG